jgi:hypothetical protein
MRGLRQAARATVEFAQKALCADYDSLRLPGIGHTDIN